MYTLFFHFILYNILYDILYESLPAPAPPTAAASPAAAAANHGLIVYAEMYTLFFHFILSPLWIYFDPAKQTKIFETPRSKLKTMKPREAN